ncbi:MAG: SagB/ThcOx family dehydrogenase [Anaerolineales bacterium]|jgi:SagB-type dehydrogenase family enzyme
MTDPKPLPKPRTQGPISLEETLQYRKSIRSFSDQPIATEQLSQLLWSVQGMADRRGRRTSPSAGALYPLEIYILTQEGIFHYQPSGHSLRSVRKGDFRRDLYVAALRQEFVLEAPLTVVITAVYRRIEVKYGRNRGPRYVHIEVGHAAQNLLLQAVALGLGAVPVGAFEDDLVLKILGIPPDHRPLYLIPVGYPA